MNSIRFVFAVGGWPHPWPYAGLRIVAVVAMLGLLLSLILTHSSAAPSISIPVSTTSITLDGVLTGNEWGDAAKTGFQLPGMSQSSVLYLKYDAAAQALLGGFILFDVTPNDMDNFYLVFDTLHDGGTAPRTDDFLLGMDRASRTWVYKGTGSGWAYAGFTNVLLSPFSTVELRSGTATLGGVPAWVGEFRATLTVSRPPAMGFLAQQYDAPTGLNGIWPSGSASLNPNSYGEIVFPAVVGTTVTTTSTTTVTRTTTMTIAGPVTITTQTLTSFVTREGRTTTATYTTTSTQRTTTTLTMPTTLTSTVTTTRLTTATIDRVVTETRYTTRFVTLRESEVFTPDNAFYVASGMIAFSIIAALVIRRRP